MAEAIQRVPAGLSSLLGTFGGITPQQIAEQIVGNVELLQFYGLQQRTVLTATNAALAEGTPLAIALPNFWCVLFAAEFQVAQTATLTALFSSIQLARATGQSITVAAASITSFGATATGTVRLPWFAPYPVMCPPGTILLSRADIIGTDANVNATLAVEVGVLG